MNINGKNTILIKGGGSGKVASIAPEEAEAHLGWLTQSSD
jgi:hypothetical protein